MFRFLTLCALAAGIVLAQPELRRAFERARLLEERNQNLDEAIRLYAQVAEKGKGDRGLAARALYQLGLLHARMKRTAEAARAWRTLIADYAEQTELVRQARAKLNPAGPKINGPVNRRVVDGDITDRPSPDGRSLAFTDWSTGNLALRNIATGEQRVLTAKRESWQQSMAQARGAVFSPDGRRIAYQWLSHDGPIQIRVIGIDGTGDRLLFEARASWDCTPLDWSADGGRILVQMLPDDPTVVLASISVSDGSLTRLATRPRFGIGTALFAADGEGVVITSRQALQSDISYLDRNGAESPLVSHPADDFAIGWLPDGRLLFGSDRLGSVGLWALRVSKGAPQGEPELQLQHTNLRWPLGLLRNGALYYVLDTGRMDIYTATIDVAGARVVEPPQVLTHRIMGGNLFPNWSPDGERLLFFSRKLSGGGGPLVYTRSNRQITAAPSDIQLSSRPQWDPDGTSVFAFGTDPAAKQGHYRVDRATGKASLVFPMSLTGSSFEGAWSPDGRYYFNRPDDWKLGIYRIDARTHEKQILYVPPPGVSIGKENLTPSPDGKWLAFHAAGVPVNGSSLMIVSVDGGESRPLMSVAGPEEFAFGAFAWTPDSKTILASRGVEGKHEIWKIALDGGMPVRIGMPMPRIAMLRLNPDGKTIAFHSGDQRSEIWVLENFLR